MTSTEQAKAAASPEANRQPHHHLPTGPGETWGGQELKRACIAAAAWLTRNAEIINSLNVFPVPDGDTGTNMALTLQAAVEKVADSPSHSASEIAQGLSYGALMGARGNSGVILSQICRGFSDGIAGKERISAREFAEGLQSSSVMAYRAVLKPVEGTILTVIRELGVGAQEAAAHTNSYSYVLEQATKAAKESVDRTPTLLDKLRDAGVVDAGGQGIYILMDGIRRYAAGEEIDSLELVSESGDRAVPAAGGHTPEVFVEHGEFGYCTNFILTGGGWNFDDVRAKLAAMGDSAVIVGDDNLVKVHIHTETPGEVLNYATGLGSLRQIGITNMQDQHEDFIQMHAAGGAAQPAATPEPARPQGSKLNGTASTSPIAVVAVVSGPGLEEVFRSMGATAIIEGGQTMNPSTEQFLKIIEDVPQNDVIVLPNNGNIIPVARQLPQLTKKQVAVVPTETVPQGMAALLALNFGDSLEDNAQEMQSAAGQIETGEITRAVRDAKVNGIDVKEGDVIGLHNNALVTTGRDTDEVAWKLLESMGAQDRELLTIYWGGSLDEGKATELRDKVADKYPNAEVELVNGGQPFYDYIISAE